MLNVSLRLTAFCSLRLCVKLLFKVLNPHSPPQLSPTQRTTLPIEVFLEELDPLFALLPVEPETSASRHINDCIKNLVRS